MLPSPPPVRTRSFGDTVLPEVQATVKAPSARNMYKGISLCYTVIVVTYMLVACTGYWAFGYAVSPFVVYSFPGPQWAVTLTLLMAIIQIVGCYQVGADAAAAPALVRCFEAMLAHTRALHMRALARVPTLLLVLTALSLQYAVLALSLQIELRRSTRARRTSISRSWWRATTRRRCRPGTPACAPSSRPPTWRS